MLAYDKNFKSLSLLCLKLKMTHVHKGIIGKVDNSQIKRKCNRNLYLKKKKKITILIYFPIVREEV